MSDNSYRINRGLTLNPQTTAPAGPTNGDIYYDATSNTFAFYDNGFWINLASRADVPSAASLNSAQLTSTVVQNSLVRVTGTTLSNLYGLAASTDGKQVILYNQSTTALIINNQSGSEPTAANRIVTFNGSNATIAAGQTAVLVYDSGQSRWVLASSPGTGGSGGINYITNFDAEASTVGWALYNNAAQNIPNSSTANSGGGTAGSGTKAFGVGGGVNNLTFVSTTSLPLRGTNSFLLTKSAANAQGEGVSFPFIIDSADQAKILGVSFDYNASTGFTTSDGTTTPLNDGTTATNAGNSDVEVFIVDVTNNLLIPVSPEFITAKGANNFTFNGAFQTSSNSLSYILALHVATASTTAWTFKFDNVVVGPTNAVGISAPKTPTIQKFLSGSGTYTTPTGVSYIRVRMVGGGGGGAGSGTDAGGGHFGGSGGASIFGLSNASGGSGGGFAGQAYGGLGGSATLGADAIGIALIGGQGGASAWFEATSTGNYGGGSGASSALGGGAGSTPPNNQGNSSPANTGGGGASGAGNASPGMIVGGGGGAGGYVDAIITAPVATYSYAVGAAGTAGTVGTAGSAGGAGGSGLIEVTEYYSNIGTGDDATLGSIAAARVVKSGNDNFANAVDQKVVVNSVEFDSAGNWEPTPDFRYRISESGYWKINGSVRYTGNVTGLRWAAIRVNGATRARSWTAAVGTGDDTTVDVSTTLKLNAGDYVELFGYQDSGGNLLVIGSGVDTYLEIFRIPEPSNLSANFLSRILDLEAPDTILEAIDTANNVVTTPTTQTWYIPSATWNLTIPAGRWRIDFQGMAHQETISGQPVLLVGLGTSSTPGTGLFIARAVFSGHASPGERELMGFNFSKDITVTVPTTLYANMQWNSFITASTVDNFAFRNNVAYTIEGGIIRATKIQ